MGGPWSIIGFVAGVCVLVVYFLFIFVFSLLVC